MEGIFGRRGPTRHSIGAVFSCKTSWAPVWGSGIRDRHVSGRGRLFDYFFVLSSLGRAFLLEKEVIIVGVVLDS